MFSCCLGDSFVVNACLARKGLDDWMVKQKYYCSSSRVQQQDCQQKNTCGLSPRVRQRLNNFFITCEDFGVSENWTK